MWKKIIEDLLLSGLSQYEIAREVGVTQAHVSDLATGRRGKRMSFDLGTRLQRLHENRCGGNRSAAG